MQRMLANSTQLHFKPHEMFNFGWRLFKIWRILANNTLPHFQQDRMFNFWSRLFKMRQMLANSTQPHFQQYEILNFCSMRLTNTHWTFWCCSPTTFNIWFYQGSVKLLMYFTIKLLLVMKISVINKDILSRPPRVKTFRTELRQLICFIFSSGSWDVINRTAQVKMFSNELLGLRFILPARVKLCALWCFYAFETVLDQKMLLFTGHNRTIKLKNSPKIYGQAF